MGLLTNIKNWFNEEDEPILEDEEVKKDLELTTQFEKVTVKEPKKEYEQEKVIEKEEEPLSERELFRSERTFGFPIDMDDEVKEEKQTRVNVLEYEKKLQKEPKKENDIEKRKFKPTPVLSPVYGILDQNYKKEDITVKEVKQPVVRKDKVNFDSIRAKAFGDLADDIEKTFAEDTALFFNLKEEIAKEEEKLNFDKKEGDISIGDAEAVYEDFGLEYDKEKVKLEQTKELIDLEKTFEKPIKEREIKVTIEENEEEATPITKENIDEELGKTDAELFDLIDSMYEERKE